MTRINTNVSSLVAQKTLARSNSQLQEALTRLSTGLRINKGKDDPAGLIASEVLRSDIISTQRAVTNSERANQLIGTADSALGQVSSLLNDIRGLVSEAANKGALSEDQLNANQAQIDSSLEAIDRIAQITSFQGRKLLDGSLAFLENGVDNTKIQDLQIDQANFGTLSQIGVNVDVVTQAQKGSLNYSFGAISQAVTLEVAGRNGAEAFNFGAGSKISDIASAVNLVSDATGVEATVQQDATKGALIASSFGADNDISITANQAGLAAGDIRVKYSAGDTTATNVVFTAATGSDPATLDVQLKTRAYEAATGVVDDTNQTVKAKYFLQINGNDNDVVLDANIGGALYSGVTVNFVSTAAGDAVPGVAAYVAGTKTLTYDVGTANAKTIANFNTALASVVDASGNQIFTASAATNDVAVGGASTGLGTFAFAAQAGVGTEVVKGLGNTANNALIFTAKVAGAQFNNVAVNYVDDALRVGATAAVTAGNELIEYDHNARKAQAVVDLSPANTDFLITAATAGKAFNGVSVKVTSTLAAGTPTAVYDANAKTLTLNIRSDGSSTSDQIRAAIDAEGTFTTSDVTGYVSGAVTAADAYTQDGIRGNTGFSGGDAGTLYVKLANNSSTANQIIASLGAAANARAAELFSVQSTADNDGTGKISANSYAAALTGGVTGGDVVATAQEVVNAINASATAGPVLTAALAGADNGITAVTKFQESTYYGDAATNNRLQFLGPENSRNIRFTAVAGQSLGVDLSTDPQVLAQSSVTLTSANPQASLTFRAVTPGNALDDTQIRFRAVGTGSQESVIYDGQKSKATADLNFASGANNNIRLEAATGGDALNGVTIAVVNDAALVGDTATAAYDAATKTLTIKVNDNTTTANTVIDAVNSEGTFGAALNFAGDATNAGTGVIATADLSATAGNTGTTGGHNGTLTFNILNTTTAAQAITLLANDSYANKYFFAQNFGTSNGSGLFDFTADNNKLNTSGGVTSEGTLIVKLATDSTGVVTTTANDLISYFNNAANAALLGSLGISVSNAEGSDGTGLLAATGATANDLVFTTNGTTTTDAKASLTTSAVNGVDASVTVTAVTSGAAFDGVQIVFQDNPLLVGNGDETASYDSASKKLTVGIKAGVTTAQNVVDAINAGLTDFTASLPGTGTQQVTVSDTGTSTGGTVTTGTPTGVSLLGNSDLADTGLTFQSTTYGSEAFVSVKSLTANVNFNLTDSTGVQSNRNTGKDISARINGIQAVGRGLQASINTSSLDISFSVSANVASGTTLGFAIVGGGAQFQLGPDVVSNQQARLGITALSTAKLGGVSGKLFELKSGGARSIKNDVGGAANIIDEVISQVTTLRGRLGAFQKTTLDTNIATLNDTLENLTDAESSIRDADFAAESARLTRAQILVQSGTSVLKIANDNPQNVLALLR
jgi:flagellin